MDRIFTAQIFKFNNLSLFAILLYYLMTLADKKIFP